MYVIIHCESSHYVNKFGEVILSGSEVTGANTLNFAQLFEF